MDMRQLVVVSTLIAATACSGDGPPDHHVLDGATGQTDSIEIQDAANSADEPGRAGEQGPIGPAGPQGERGPSGESSFQHLGMMTHFDEIEPVTGDGIDNHVKPARCYTDEITVARDAIAIVSINMEVEVDIDPPPTLEEGYPTLYIMGNAELRDAAIGDASDLRPADRLHDVGHHHLSGKGYIKLFSNRTYAFGPLFHFVGGAAQTFAVTGNCSITVQIIETEFISKWPS